MEHRRRGPHNGWSCEANGQNGVHGDNGHNAAESSREQARDVAQAGVEAVVPVQEAVEEVKSSGIESVHTVKEEATATASDLTARAKGGAQNVQESRRSH